MRIKIIKKVKEAVSGLVCPPATQDLKLNTKNKANSKVMSKNEVLKFMQTYQRITQNMFKFTPKYSSIVLNLNRNHQIKSVKYKK